MGEILTGDYLTFKAPLGGKGKIGMIGKSTQKTRSGKNKLKVEDGTITINGVTVTAKDGKITINGTATADLWITFAPEFKSGTIIDTSGTPLFEVTSAKKFTMSVNKISGTYNIPSNQKYFSIIANRNSNQFNVNIGANKLSTTVDLSSTDQIYAAWIMISKDIVLNNYKFNIQIEEGEVKTDYEEYGVMPSPKFPSAIRNSGDDINLFDGKLEQGSISLETGIIYDTNSHIRSKNYISIDGQKYSKIKLIRSVAGGKFRIYLYDSNKKYISYKDPNNDYSNAYNNAKIAIFLITEDTKFIKFIDASNNLNSKIKITTDLSSYKYSEFNKGNILIKNSCKNLISQEEVGNYNNYSSYLSRINEGFKTTSNFAYIRDVGTYLGLKKNMQYTISFECISIETTGNPRFEIEVIGYNPYDNNSVTGMKVIKQQIYGNTWVGKKVSFTFNSSNYDFWTLHISGFYDVGFSGILIYRNVQVEEGAEATEFKDGNQEFEFPLKEGQVLMYRDYLADDGIHHVRGQRNVNGTESNWVYYSANEEWARPYFQITNKKLNEADNTYNVICDKMAQGTWDNSRFGTINKNVVFTYSEDRRISFLIKKSDLETQDVDGVKKYFQNNNMLIEYNLEEEVVEPYTPEQQTVYNLLQKVALYNGVNNIFSSNELSPTFNVEVSKLVDDCDFYVSTNGYLTFPKYNKKYLTNISDSSLFNMPEAVQSTAKIAGKDGDLVLDSSYNPIEFNIIMFTDEGLTPEQKEKERFFINKFFNEMKKNTKTFAFEQSQKFYKVMYFGVVEESNYPQHLMFTLPIKSSKSYAYKIASKYLLGNDNRESDTIEPTGFKCIIYGPALNPIISLNDYSMEFDNTILEGEKLVIDTNNSTVVLINSNGIETNAMKYYNHQFPKILTGTNELKVLSGIDNPNNVFISWYDLTL